MVPFPSHSKMSSEPVHAVVTFVIKPGKLADFFNILKPVVQHLERNNPGVLRLYSFQSKTQDEKDQVTFVEKFANAQALQHHHESQIFLDMVEKLNEVLDGSPDVKIGSFVLGFENK